MKRGRSLTRRLLGTVLLLELVSATGLIGASVFYEWRTHLGAFDVMLRGRADTLLGAVGDAEDQGDNVMLDMTGLTIPANDVYRVEDEKGHILGRSRSLIPPYMLVEASQKSSVIAVKIDGRHYRLLRVTGMRVVDPGDANGGVRHEITVYYGSRTNHIWHDVMQAARFYAITTILLFAITTITMVWLLRRDLAPLHQLANEAGKISARNWSFQPPPAAEETKELLPLVRAIEAALARLQRSFEQQRRFTSDAAHELKTDVAIAKSSLQLLSMRSRTIDEYRRGLELCFDDCTRLERTVQQMLTLARVEQGETSSLIAGEHSQCSIRDCLETSICQTATFAQLRRVNVKFRSSGNPTVGVDERDCTLLCSNLLLNALQHSPVDSVVHVALEESGEKVIVAIEDQGEGIAAQDLAYIFEPFYRGDPSRNRESGGTGLGLAICKAICEKAGGSIRIDNLPDTGAKATIQLPTLRHSSYATTTIKTAS